MFLGREQLYTSDYTDSDMVYHANKIRK